MALEMHDECIDTVKIPWRGNRRSSFAQEFHASERERETERPSLLPFKGTANYDRDDAVSFSTESPRPQKSSGVLTLKALKELKKAFDALGTLTTNGRLDKEGFVRECMRIDEMQAYVSKMEMEQLFMKVDVNNNGSVDWNDFTSFILLHQLAKEDGLVSEFSPYVKVRTQNNKSFDELSEESESDKEEEDAVECVPPKSHKCLESGDVAMLRPSPVIEKIIKLNAIQTYVSCSQDGYLKLWHTDSLKLLRVQENGNGAWISDITAMAQQPLAVFAMDRSITFYDTGRLSFDVLGRIKNLDNVPISATWMRTIDNDKLLYGDDNGYLHVLNFTDEWGGENPKVAPGVAEYLLPGMSEDEPWLIHSSWVTRLLYLTHSCTLMTGSMDGYLMMLDIEKQRKKWSAKEHHHGICAFAYGRSLNFIASCGLERHINIWNPFTARIMGTLTGHQAPVVDVVVNDKENQVISVASDSLIKIWDMRTHRCLQTIIERSNPKSLDPPILNRIFYDQSKNMLLAGGSVLEAWKHKGSSESKVKKICAVLYSPIFQQIVIGEETDSTVTIWDIETGGKLFSFSDTIKKTKMSAMSFDFSGRRLIIGGQQGRLSMWNFNNGQFLKEFKGFGQNEVSCVACLEEGKMKFVAAGGWNGKVCIWGDGSKEHEFVEHSTRGHSDDVICMTFFPPNCFATGSYDGKVIIWKVDGMIRCILQTSNSGQKEEFSDPITSLLNFPQEKVIAGVSAHGYLYFWRVPEPKTIFEASLGHSTQPGPICLDSNNQVLFTSDIKGYVKAWTMKDMRFQEEYEDSKMSELFCFRAHHETIVSMIFIDEKKLLLTASVFFTCRLWTDTGVKIGQFGQSDPWNLDLPDTWSSSTPTYVASIAISRDSSDSISSPHSSSRISTSAGTSGDHSANNQQMSRGNSATAPLEGSGEAKDQSREHSNDELVKQNDVRDADTESAQYPYSVISQILDNGPPHLQLNSWFRPLQIAYNRKLPIKILVPFGAVIPSNVSHVRKKGHRESVTTVTPTINRKKSRVQVCIPV